MNNKGFTLIELLGVIFVLGILALVSTVSITSIVKNSKEDLYETQINSIKMAAETWGSENIDKLPLDSECKILTVLDLKSYGLLDEELLDPNTNEKISDDLNIKITATINKKGNLHYTYEVNPTDITDCVNIYEYTFISNGTPLYFDVAKGTGCNDYKSQNSVTGYNGINPTGEQNSCLKFYAFNDSEKSYAVNMILDHNTTSYISWYKDGSSNSNGPDEIFLNKLKSDTNGWLGVEKTSPINYIPSKMYGDSAPYKINYEGYNARLISAEEIAKITENDRTSSNNWLLDENFLFDENLRTCQSNKNCTKGSNKYAWLFDYTRDCVSYGCNIVDNNANGYYTSTSSAKQHSSVWVTNYDGILGIYGIYGTAYGIRPVIRVSKSKLLLK